MPQPNKMGKCKDPTLLPFYSEVRELRHDSDKQVRMAEDLKLSGRKTVLKHFFKMKLCLHSPSFSQNTPMLTILAGFHFHSCFRPRTLLYL